jgi:hypothetical protein
LADERSRDEAEGGEGEGAGAGHAGGSDRIKAAHTPIKAMPPIMIALN